MAKAPTKTENEELRNRRDRLEALKSRRNSSAAPAPEAPASPPPGGGIFGGGGRGGPGAAKGGPNRALQRKMLMKVHSVLTQTPEDGNGRVPDTPFTQSGVARLMGLLEERSSDPSKPGAKLAGGVLKFLRPAAGEDATSSGASVAKLQAVARRMEAMRNKAGRTGRGGAR